MPMPSKRRSVLVHSSVETYTPPDTSSASEDEGSLRRPGRLTSTLLQSHSSVEPWLDRVIQGSSTSSSASSTSSHPGGRPTTAPSAAATPGAAAAIALTGLAAHAHI
ncbi:PREDICTED: disco-interacting protein 2 homolog A-like, partial [Galeopterus variegatus]|uniref:Disco-interacting protein 2 homolog A-like n=1 Tax=Galeopterus variegatus TaxID=482537 RepID=A0ABM0SB62_GALVR